MDIVVMKKMLWMAATEGLSCNRHAFIKHIGDTVQSRYHNVVAFAFCRWKVRDLGYIFFAF
jgi:hypothetical protein